MGDVNVLSKFVLVLNQNYEPLSVCNVKRAIILVYLGKAEIIEQDSVRLKAAAWSIHMPLVVRLFLYVSVPHKKVILSRKNIIKRDNHQCQYCGSRLGPMTVDHIVPKKMGGTESWENLVCACVTCNNKKGNRTPEQAGIRLMRIPSKPTHLMFIQHFVGIRSDKWKPYLFMS